MKKIRYNCDFCGQEFESGKERNGPKYCGTCAGKLRRLGLGPQQQKKLRNAEPQHWYTIDEAAEYLRISRRTIYQLLEQGDLVSYRVGKTGHKRFKREDLDQVMHKEGDAEVHAMSAAENPVLAELWDNEKDAAYDQL